MKFNQVGRLIAAPFVAVIFLFCAFPAATSARPPVRAMHPAHPATRTVVAWRAVPARSPAFHAGVSSVHPRVRPLYVVHPAHPRSGAAYLGVRRVYVVRPVHPRVHTIYVGVHPVYPTVYTYGYYPYQYHPYQYSISSYQYNPYGYYPYSAYAYYPYDTYADLTGQGYSAGFHRGQDDAEDHRIYDPYRRGHYRKVESVTYQNGFLHGYAAGYGQ